MFTHFTQTYVLKPICLYSSLNGSELSMEYKIICVANMDGKLLLTKQRRLCHGVI